MARTISDNDKRSMKIEDAYKNGKYILSYRSVYQPHYSGAQGRYYATEVFYNQQGNMTLAGRYFHMTGDQINHLLKMPLLNNL